MTDQMLARLRNNNWRKTMLVAHDQAIEDLRLNATLEDHHLAWALLKEAAKVSRVAYRGPPPSGFPTSSSMPDSVDDVTQWQIISAYLQGQLTSLPEIQSRPPKPSGEEVDRAALILHLWHHHALKRKGDKSRMKKAVYMKASGIRPRRIAAVTGMSVAQIQKAKIEASEDIYDQIKRFFR